VKKREPTPDLTDIIPILERQRRMTQWDIKPPGYENITAEQAKLSGMFPLPGAPRQQPMDPKRLEALVNQPQNAAATSALKPAMARQSKRLLVYNVPASATGEDLANFFNLQLNGINLVKSTDPCQAAHIAKNGNHALLEFKSPNDATVALALDGITMTDDSMETSDGTSNGSSGLSIKRPKDYIGPQAAPPVDVTESQITNDVPDSTEKLLITNLAPFLDEEQIKQLLIAIGPLKALVLAVDDGGQSRVSRKFHNINHANSRLRVSPSANTPIPSLPTSRSRVSTIWTSVVRTSSCCALVWVKSKSQQRWASTRCR
jgi:splicing factor U2AF subunit